MQKPIAITITVHATASPETVYEIAKDSAGYPRWSAIGAFEHVRAGADEEYGVGSRRIYRTGPLKLLEEVVELVPNQRVGYILLNGLPFRDYRAEITISPAADGAWINWRNSFYPTLPLTRTMCKRFMQGVLARIAPELGREAERIERLNQPPRAEGVAQRPDLDP